MNERLVHAVENDIDVNRIMNKLEWETDKDERAKLIKLLATLETQMSKWLGRS